MGFPSWLQPHAENVWKRFPEEFLALGSPRLEDAFVLSPSYSRITDTNGARIVEIVLPRRHPCCAAEAVGNESPGRKEQLEQGIDKDIVNVKLSSWAEGIISACNTKHQEDLALNAKTNVLEAAVKKSRAEEVALECCSPVSPARFWKDVDRDARYWDQYDAKDHLVPLSPNLKPGRRRRRGSQSGQRQLGCMLKVLPSHDEEKDGANVDNRIDLSSDQGLLIACSENVLIPAVSRLAMRRGFYIQPFEESSNPFQSSCKFKTKSMCPEAEQAESPGTLLLLLARHRQALQLQNRSVSERSDSF